MELSKTDDIVIVVSHTGEELIGTVASDGNKYIALKDVKALAQGFLVEYSFASRSKYFHFNKAMIFTYFPANEQMVELYKSYINEDLFKMSQDTYFKRLNQLKGMIPKGSPVEETAANAGPLPELLNETPAPEYPTLKSGASQDEIMKFFEGVKKDKNTKPS